MQRILSLDIGTRRTGIAYGELPSGIVVALDTIQHDSDAALIDTVVSVVHQRKVGALCIGLPLLLSGHEGKQSDYVRSVGQMLSARLHLPIHWVDERFTTSRAPSSVAHDPDAGAACSIVETWMTLQQKRKSEHRNGIDIKRI